jgi:Flp pilus assembly protein TadG
MKPGAGAHATLRRMVEAIRRLRHDRRGVAAVEFAFIAPILMIMYFLTMEASQAIETSKKVNRVSSMVGDLIAQQSTVNTSTLDAILRISNATLQPYNRSMPTIVVTGIKISNDPTPKVQVAWSRRVVNGVYMPDAAVNSTTTVPDSLKIGGTFLVRVTTNLAYRPVIAWAAGDHKTLGLTNAFDNINMSETFYLRPRVTSAITCSNC